MKQLFLLTTGLLLFYNSYAQDILWEKVSVPDSIEVETLCFTNNQIMFIGTSHGIFRSLDYGTSWELSDSERMVDVFYLHSENLIVSNEKYSYDYGISWENHILNTVIVGLDKKKQVYTPDMAGRLLRMSSDFSRVDTVLDPEFYVVRYADIVEHPNGMLFTGTYCPLGGGGVLQSDDGGDTWEVVGLDGAFVFGLAIGSDQNIFAAKYGGSKSPADNKSNGAVYKSSNLGVNWTRLMDDYVAARSVVVTSKGHIYVGCSGFGNGEGVLRSLDNGETWEIVNDGFPAYNVEKLWLAPDETLYSLVSIYVVGEGSHNELYRTTQPVNTPHVVDKNDKTLFCYPNPAKGIVTIDLDLKKPFWVKVFDINGRVVYNMAHTKKQINLSHLPQGCYQLSVLTQKNAFQQSLVIHK